VAFDVGLAVADGAGVASGDAVRVAADVGMEGNDAGAPNRATPPGSISESRIPLAGLPGYTSLFRKMPSTCPEGGAWTGPASDGASGGTAGEDIRVMVSAPTAASCRGDAASRTPANARRAERTPR
jgi:hypothetical protein